VREKKGRLSDLKIGYVGDVWNMAHSWGIVSSLFGWEMNYALPSGYDYWPRAKEFIDKTNKESGGSFKMTQDLKEAMTGADVVVGITFVSMTRGATEEDMKRKLKDFMPYQINSKAMSWAEDDAIYMHCLPAHRGEEVTSEVLDGPQSFVFDQAENRMHTEKALMALLLGGVQ
jgi:ornithine carbamoyltransferase